MSKFFRSAGSDSSESSDSGDLNELENDSLRPTQDVEGFDVSSVSLGNGDQRSLIPAGSASARDFNKDLMAHALLEDRCLDDIRKELAGTTSEAAISAAAAQRYKSVSARLIAVGLLAPGLDADIHAQARKQFRQGLDFLSRSTSGRKGSAEVRAPFRRLLTGADAGIALTVRDKDLQLAQLPGAIPSALNHLVPQHNAFGNSRYRQDFDELGVLGKGGYGVVYSCRHKLDGVTYAVKKVPLSPSRRERIIAHGQPEIDALLSEVRTLAQLDHPNIVRYFNGWIDWINADASTLANSDEVQLVAEDARFSEGISFGRVITESDDDHHIAFENSVSHASTNSAGTTANKSTASESEVALRRTASQGTRATVSEDDVESVPRNDTSEPSESVITDTDGIKLGNTGPQLALHMQMALYPMTLTSFLAADSVPEASYTDALPLRHCFHLQPSVRIILAILEGVDYLHRRNMIHRDLKPGNVFLAPCHDSRSEGSIDLFDCDGCWNADAEDTVGGAECGITSERPRDERESPQGEKPNPDSDLANAPTALSLASRPHSLGAALPISPPALGAPQSQIPTMPPSKSAIRVRIGDFGLVTALAHSSSPASSPVGTELYRAPSTSNTSPVLDIYALGIIAFELLWPFGTRMERHSTIHDLKEGRFPTGFSTNFGGRGGMEECIEAMLSGNVEIGDIRSRLLDML